MTPVRRHLLQRLAAGYAGLSGLSALVGCSALDTHPGQTPAYYLLQDLRPNAPASGATGTGVLLLGGASAAALHDSDRLVYTRDGLAHAYYQFAHWSERPGKRLAMLAEQRLAGSGRYAAVLPSVAGVRGDWMLQLRLDELTHDVRPESDQAAGGRVLLRVSATLVDWRQRDLIARQTFETVQRVPRPEARSAAQAASLAATAWLDALQAWLLSVTPPTPSR